MACDFRDKTGFSDTGLAGDRGEGERTAACLLPESEKLSEIVLAADERRQPAQGTRGKAAGRLALAAHAVEPDRTRQSLERAEAEILAVEQTFN